MGFRINATVAPGATDQLRNMILGGCVDANILRWLFGALVSASRDNVIGDAALLCEARDPPVYTAPRPDGWIVDIGCTTHITAVEKEFMWTKPITPPIMVKGLMKEAISKGGVHIQVDSTSGPKRIMLREVMYVPGPT